MTSQEKIYFEELSKDRAESADMLEKPSMRGIKKSVVEKYSDQAHFIYELLQNADDAHATNARFLLEPTRLIFAHNGTRHFSVSNPANEDDDSAIGKLGDINAITSIANSNKTEASIGKFGVGFKAVFQYTSTPHIYDPEFRFRIDRFIVPTLLVEDFPGRNKDETMFIFPFDHPERKADEAYNDISDKLKNLSFPLLFLSELKDIMFEIDNVIGLYGKNIKKTYSFADTDAEYICLTQNDGDDLYDKNLWLFSRLDTYNRRYSVGFFTDKDGHLKPINEPAFCFFPTKEVTGLNFILHASFLLTDSREGIRAGVPYNDSMIQQLASLAADTMVYLRDIGDKESIRLIADNIIDLIPYNQNKFSDPSDKRKVSFLPFYHSIKAKFKTEAILPSTEGYVASCNAYWAAVPQLPRLFSNKQLSNICENENAHWVFATFGRSDVQHTNGPLCDYIDSLVKTNLNEDAIISGRSKEYYYNRVLERRFALENVRGITAEFIEKQSVEWLHEFYRWLSETKHRTEIISDKPIFLDQSGKAVAAFDKAGQLILFLPVKEVTGYTVVHPELLENPDTRKFIETIGIKQPSLKNQIYNRILPQYKNGSPVDVDSHFMLFFEYYCKCSNDEVEEFIDLIKNYEFLTYYDEKHSHYYCGPGNSMYFPAPDICAFLETKKDVRFVTWDKYRKLVGISKEKELISFLIELGVKKEIEIVEVDIDYEASGRRDLPYERSTRGYSWKENRIDGCREIIESIVANQDKEKSILLWNCLLRIIETNNKQYRTFSSLFSGVFRYHYRDWKKISFISSDAILLKSSKWMINETDEFVTPASLTKSSLSNVYNTSSDFTQDLFVFLNILEETVEEPDTDDSYLTDSQRQKIEFANKLKALGIDESDLEEFQEFKRQRDAKRKRNLELTEHAEHPEQSDVDSENTIEEDYENGHISKTTSKIVKDIVCRTKNISGTAVNSDFYLNSDDEDEADRDELMPSVVDYSKKIEQAKQKSASEIEKITCFDELQSRVMATKKYSFEWFNILLEMECLNSNETNSNSKEVSISFSSVEKEPGTKRTLVLKHPSRYIPQFMEDITDIPLMLHMGDKVQTVVIEAANIKSYTLHVKLKNSTAIDELDLSSVTAATIETKSPVFLLDELRKQFLALDYDDTFDMQNNLCENIEFIFGPPGTGKTTYLARNVLIPLMKENCDCKVLVLTPTNKAADVLANRIIELSSPDRHYEEWLVRFGTTGDEHIEQSPVFRDKTFDIRTLAKNVTITTIARFPYDFFMPRGVRVFLNGIKWDYIVIDEASMIPIANIIYPLYKKTPIKFIIAGDPFQIEPITSINIWKNENIYTLVHLDSFTNATTVPHRYKIELLTTQYRSLPDIGNIFSKFTYGGILKHYRTIDSQKPLNIGPNFDVKTLNIIKFPVSKYESIYRAKKLQHSSSYQIYSALFTYEYICHMSRAIAYNYPDSLYKIGVIAPYRAQADLIDKLLAAERLPKEVDVQVGTIHGFQGDECDIIFSVFNTPPLISPSSGMFLNKRNIINVSISRARDYLFIIMPDDNTENIVNLSLVKRVERLIKGTNTWVEFLTSELENMMFGDSKFLENNTFSTNHQNVNVYELPEKHYEVRTEDSAIDIQVYRDIPKPFFS